MDKKNTFIGLIILGVALFMMIREGQKQNEYLKYQEAVAQQAAADRAAAAEAGEGEAAPAASAFTPLTGAASGASAAQSSAVAGASGAVATGGAAAGNGGAASGEGLFSRPAGATGTALGGQAEIAPQQTAETYTLQNDYIRVTFTSKGGAIEAVEFVERGANEKLRYPQTVDSDIPYAFNRGALTPALSLALAGDATTAPTDYAPQFELLQKTDTLIQFRYRDPNGGVIVRGYQIEEAGRDDQPYVIAHATKLENIQSHPLSLPALYLNVGSVPPTEGDYMSQYLNFGYYESEDGKARFYQLYRMKGFFGMFGAGALEEQPAEIKSFVEGGQPQIGWGSIKNQFFATVLTPTNIKASNIFATPVELIVREGERTVTEIGGTGALGFNLGELAPGESKIIEANFYCGPKEYLRLAKLTPSLEQDKVMQFGYLASISKMLLWALVGIHNALVAISPNWAWGWAIIVLTIIIKGVLWPLTQVQVRSSKRMAKIQKPMAELREKFKDNPQKMNQEMMKLWKEHKVNPLAGCLPILVQFPIFIGLFFMLRTSSELRFAPFLWVKDLSAPEHLFNWGVNVPFLGEYFNLLPILMGVTMFFQMRMTPTPVTDNMQRRIFQAMPFIFLLFCYRFPSGLVIYWTGQNLITIFQQWLTNRRKDDEPAPAVTAVAPAPAKKGKGPKKARA